MGLLSETHQNLKYICYLKFLLLSRCFELSYNSTKNRQNETLSVACSAGTSFCHWIANHFPFPPTGYRFFFNSIFDRCTAPTTRSKSSSIAERFRRRQAAASTTKSCNSEATVGLPHDEVAFRFSAVRRLL